MKCSKTKAGFCLAGIVAAGAAVGVGIAAYNSKPMRMKRMVKRAVKTMSVVGVMMQNIASSVIGDIF